MEEVIFSIDPVEFYFDGRLTSSKVSNSILWMGIQKEILKIDLNQIFSIQKIDLLQSTQYELFVDDLSQHMLVAFDNGEHFLYFHKWHKPKYLPKWKGLVIECLTWIPCKEGQRVLLGTRNGVVYESLLNPLDEGFTRTPDKYLKQLWRTPEPSPITGIHAERLAPHLYRILLSTLNQLYAILQPTAEAAPSYLDTKALFRTLEFESSFHSTIANHSSMLSIYAKNRTGQKYAWCTENGIFIGEFTCNIPSSQDCLSTPLDGSHVIDQVILLPLPNADQGIAPLGMCLTEFHVLLLYPKKLMALNFLTDKVVFESSLDPDKVGALLGLTCDPIQRTYWLSTEFQFYEILVRHETRHIWQIYLSKCQYGKALAHCHSQEQRDFVLMRQAEEAFDQQNYLLSAELFAKMGSVPLTEALLKFAGLKDRQPLKAFLLAQLHAPEQLQAHQQQEIRENLSLMATWLAEIYLRELDASPTFTSDLDADPDAKASDTKKEHAMVRDEFITFLNTPYIKEHLDKGTMYQLVGRHGREEDLYELAKTLQDYDTLISLALVQNQPSIAIELLRKHSNPSLVYRYSYILIQILPLETVQLWKDCGLVLDPKALLTSLIRYDQLDPPPLDKVSIPITMYSRGVPCDTYTQPIL